MITPTSAQPTAFHPTSSVLNETEPSGKDRQKSATGFRTAPSLLDERTLSVLQIQRTCVHDGPGIRTTVFFRGCPLRCRWCHNPEAQAFVRLDEHLGHTPNDIIAQVTKDHEYYELTNGGVTLSGGEPLAQHLPSLLALLRLAKEQGLHVTVETAGDVPWRVFQAVAPYVDLFMFDLKLVGSPKRHRELTGRDGRRIEANFRRLMATGASVKVRQCIVPGLNDSPDDIKALADLLKSTGQSEIELLRYHDLYEKKNNSLSTKTSTNGSVKSLGICANDSLKALQYAIENLAFNGINARTTAFAEPKQPATFTQRVKDIKQAIREAGYSVCIESAQLKTDFLKKPSNAPVAIWRANLLRHLLNHKTIRIYPNELIVGNFTSKRVGGHVWVDYMGIAAIANVWGIDRQTPVPFACSRADMIRFYTKIAPYWLVNSLQSRVFPRLQDFGKFALRAAEKCTGFNNNMASIAHFLVNNDRLLRLGTSGIATQARQLHTPANPFHDSVLLALKALDEFAERYVELLNKMAAKERDPRRQAELLHMAEVCAWVPKNPARTFHEALQAIMFLQIALCTESFENAISPGRLDQILYPYYKADVEAGRVDYESAKELMACFILKMDEIVFLNDGDRLFQFGKLFESLSPVETVTVGGTDGQGNDATNDVTYMILDVCELRPISVNMAARIHKNSPAEYVERIAQVYLNGSPMPALYNDEVYVQALCREYGVSDEDARGYGIVGCVEPVASDDHFANTDSANVNVVLPFIQALTGDTSRLWHLGDLGRLNRRFQSILLGNRPPASMDELMQRFRQRLQAIVRDILAEQQLIETTLASSMLTPLASSLYQGCMTSGRDVYEGGTKINSSGIQAVGITDVADSLLAIDHLVFKEGRYTMHELLQALEADFLGWQRLHQDLLSCPKFGNDSSDEPTRWMHQVMQAWVDALGKSPHPSRNGKYVAGYYGLNVNRVYGKKTPSLPSGRRRGEPLANSLCPHFGMQMVDLTSSLNAVARLDFAKFAPNGTTLTPTIDTGMFPGHEGVRNLAGLICGFFNQGGMQLQPNLVSRALLQDAYDNPGKHKDLVVRIAGYCAYFDDLSDELKREMLARTYYS